MKSILIRQSTIYISTADMVETSVQTMVKEVLLGALFATIVIMVFLRNIRSTFITIVSIPLSLAFTMFLLSLSGVTLNILTLGGVAVAIGRLVDDSIVVIENIFRKMQQEKFSIQMVIDATKEVGVGHHGLNTYYRSCVLASGLIKWGTSRVSFTFCFNGHLFFIGFITCRVNSCATNEC